MEEDAGECIVIGVDNSRWVPLESDIFQDQCDAIEFYCRAKFNENPKTVVSLYTMGRFDSRHLGFPTGSIKELVAKFPCINPGCGEVDLLDTFSFGCLPFAGLLGQQDQYKKKRMVLFVGGLTNLSMLCVDDIGKAVRNMGIAVDVIYFYTGGPPEYPTSTYQYGRRELMAFIESCNGGDNGNSHFVHVGSRRSICDALSESPLLKPTPCQSEEQNVYVKKRAGVEESIAAWGIRRGAVEIGC